MRKIILSLLGIVLFINGLCSSNDKQENNVDSLKQGDLKETFSASLPFDNVLNNNFDYFFSNSSGSQWAKRKHKKTLKKDIQLDVQITDPFLIYSSFDFDVYYYNEDVVSDIITTLDSAYNSIIEDLNYAVFFKDQKIKIYVYRNQAEYIKRTNSRNWSGGYTNVRKNIIYTFEQKNLMKNVIVHELTHLIFDFYMGFPRNNNLTWIHEGLAVYEEKKFFDKKWNIKYLKSKDSEGNLYPMRDAFRTQSGLGQDKGEISLWYLQMGTVVYFLLTLNREGFKVFCDNLKVYKNVDEALKYTYPWDFKNIEELDLAWRKWLYEQGDYI